MASNNNMAGDQGPKPGVDKQEKKNEIGYIVMIRMSSILSAEELKIPLTRKLAFFNYRDLTVIIDKDFEAVE